MLVFLISEIVLLKTDPLNAFAPTKIPDVVEVDVVVIPEI